jgi:hypothetical protein
MLCSALLASVWIAVPRDPASAMDAKGKGGEASAPDDELG